jgi:hypothetical protein
MQCNQLHKTPAQKAGITQGENAAAIEFAG